MGSGKNCEGISRGKIMKRRSCQYWNKQKAKGHIGCTEQGICSDKCQDYVRRVKWAQWKVPLSQCLFIRYRRRITGMVKICAVSQGIAKCIESCPHFTRRKKKTIKTHNPHIPFYRGKKEIGFDIAIPKDNIPAKNHPWRKTYKRIKL